MWPPQATFAEVIKGQISSSPGEPSPMSAERSIIDRSLRHPESSEGSGGAGGAPPAHTGPSLTLGMTSQLRSFRFRQQPNQRAAEREEQRGAGDHGGEPVPLRERADAERRRGRQQPPTVVAEALRAGADAGGEQLRQRGAEHGEITMH